MKEKLIYKSSEGVAEPQALSDVQQYNKALKFIGYVMFCFFLYLVWLTYYVISHNVLNNIIGRCIK